MSLQRTRRQKYFDEVSYLPTLQVFDENKTAYAETLEAPPSHVHAHASALHYRALDLWDTFQLRYTAGDEIAELAKFLGEVVCAYDLYVKHNAAVSEEKYTPPFILDDTFDAYAAFLHLLCAAILLHREDLLPTIFGWIKGGPYDGADAILEELFNFYFPDRPSPEEWLWGQPYEKLLDVIDATASTDRAKLMKNYLKGWYKSLKGKAEFWGAHERITPEFSPYFGYWAMCAGAFTYLLDIDDTSYRAEEVYPKDMVDYARSMPRCAVKQADGSEILRVEGGQPCPSEGTWFSPAKSDSSRYFKVGEIMPVFEASEYGHTIWQRV
jgi:hypothetical protein